MRFSDDNFSTQGGVGKARKAVRTTHTSRIHSLAATSIDQNVIGERALAYKFKRGHSTHLKIRHKILPVLYFLDYKCRLLYLWNLKKPNSSF